MQNNQNKPSKGFYILVAVCVLVIGVSGYFFLHDAARENKEMEAVMSVPPRAQMDKQDPMKEGESQPPAEQTMVPHDLEETVMPVSGSVLQGYAMDQLAYNQTTKDWRTHGGVDLAAQPGEAVKAARSGAVMAVYEDEFLGTTVMLQHEGGYTSMYSGLEAETAVTAGQSVTAGQTIGKVGNTALIETAMESHLHFEVCKDGETVDPASFLY